MLALPSRRLAREGVPIAVILLFWNLLAVVPDPHGVGGAVRSAGVVMATLYVVVRGAGLASEAVGPVTGNPEAALRENARLAVPAGAWFLGSMVVFLASTATHLHVLSTVVERIASALAGAGLGVVGLYAVATGFAAFRSRPPTEASQADD
jgi:hypothetical protein